MHVASHTLAQVRTCPSLSSWRGSFFAELLLSEQILICSVLVKVSDSSEGDSGLRKALPDRRLPLPATIKLMTCQCLKAGHSFSHHSSAMKR